MMTVTQLYQSLRSLPLWKKYRAGNLVRICPGDGYIYVGAPIGTEGGIRLSDGGILIINPNRRNGQMQCASDSRCRALTTHPKPEDKRYIFNMTRSLKLLAMAIETLTEAETQSVLVLHIKNQNLTAQYEAVRTLLKLK